ncbi:MAG: group III truncated hemoglobin [Bacteroidia bacterium]|jgi:hemoglobin|nr:group III truncated hemoglobin [Bacteroidia bacterium]
MNESKPDITGESDIVQLLTMFYQRVLADERLARFFSGIDMQAHLPRIAAFWSGLLFNTGGFSGNVMNVHTHIHHQYTLSAADFARWLELFNDEVDRNFAGFRADEIKSRARSIAGVMSFRITGQV